MATPSDSVVFGVGIDLNKLRTGLDQSVRLVRRTVGSIEGAFRALSNPFAALGIGAGAAGIGALISKAASFADELDEASSRIGINVERLQELQHGARLTGAGVEGLEKGLVKLNKALGEAGSGNAEAIKLFTDLGIKVRDDVTGNLRDAGDVIDALADKLAATESPAERTRLVTAAFGREGAKLIPLLEGGAEGLKTFGQEARKLGTVLERDTITAAAKLKDQIDALVTSISPSLTRTLVALGPGIEFLVLKLTEGAAAIGKMTQSALPDKLAPLVELETRIAALGRRIEELKKQLKGASLGDSLNLFFGHGDSLKKALATLEKQQVELFELRKKKQTEAATGKGGAGGSAESEAKLAAFQSSFVTAVAPSDIVRQIEQFKQKAEELAGSLAGPQAAAVRAMASAYGAWKTSIDETQQAQARLDAGQAGAGVLGLDSTNVFSGLQDIKKIEGAAKGFRESIRDLIDQGIPLSQVFETINGAQAGVSKTLEDLKAKYAGTPAIFEKLLELERQFGNGGLQREADAIARSVAGVTEGTAAIVNKSGEIVTKVDGVRKGISAFIDTTEGISATVIPRLQNTGIALQGVVSVIDNSLIPAASDAVQSFVVMTEGANLLAEALNRVRVNALLAAGVVGRGTTGVASPGNF